MKNKSGLTALITGASNGIGLELTRKLLSEDWHVIGLNRSKFPAEDEVIQQAMRDKRLREYQADLTDFEQLKQALNTIKAKEAKIDVLFNNAGGSLSEIRYSKQNREMHFELQTVAPYIIFMELKELLHNGSLRTVVNTSTNAFATLKAFDPETLERPSTFKKLFGPYAATKLALSLWTREMASLAELDGIIIRSADPGGNNTIRKGNSAGLPFYLKPFIKLFFPPPSKGAALLYDAALGQHRGLNGVFFMKGKVVELKFIDQGRRVLEKVDAIYKQDYKNLA
ncbi:short-chain dehydrogenase/reductase SDR [Paenibacillus curdlanolyticus YK9]|uniref:Short-chain dehydrogenase/reductase SDR n=1 Tax=Paenibacillus curdlanolyticus YK9 TaxID=717606 RepID=E0I9F6_9BACL|nr:SDR family NAD(P)-dependent oxidoreductase [Paenibacillus curdlanolyticus]EFM11040.1 short-chain dehydrogenase/reductase SDR [Paenibacillus curdlanolyticus YK9]